MDDECGGFIAWCAHQDDKTILDCINDRTASRYLIDLFYSACRWNRVIIVDELLKFPLVGIFKNNGLNLACRHDALTVVNYMLSLPGLDLSRGDWYCVQLALNEKNKTITVRLLQDVRIPKKELTWRWADNSFSWIEGQMRARDLCVLLTQSRLRMMVMYSKGFGRISGLPKELVHLISSYTEPYHIEELKQFASFVEKIERCRSF
jgi:hypothetical protein